MDGGLSSIWISIRWRERETTSESRGHVGASVPVRSVRVPLLDFSDDITLPLLISIPSSSHMQDGSYESDSKIRRVIP